MPSIQATLREEERELASSLPVTLSQASDPLSGSFTLPVRCSINLHVPHSLLLPDGRAVPITITRLSHFSGDVEFCEAPKPVSAVT